jgi:hypothetical protein
MSAQLGEMVRCISECVHGPVMRRSVPALASFYRCHCGRRSRLRSRCSTLQVIFFREVLRTRLAWMQCAPRYIVGVCKPDPAKQLTSFRRRNRCTWHFRRERQRHARVDPVGRAFLCAMHYTSATAEQLKAFSTLAQTSGARRGTGTTTAASRDVKAE